MQGHIHSEKEKRRLVQAVAHFEKLVALYSTAIESANKRYNHLASALESGTAAKAADEDMAQLFPAFAGGRVMLHRSGSVDLLHQRAVPSAFESLSRRIFPGSPVSYRSRQGEDAAREAMQGGEGGRQRRLRVVDLYTEASQK